MKQNTVLKMLIASAIAGVLAIAAAAPSHAVDDGGVEATADDSGDLLPSEETLLYSDDLKRITVDPATGSVVAVEPMTEAELEYEFRGESAAEDGPFTVEPFVAYPGMCTPTTIRPCWHGAVPTVNIGFSYGITYGTWGSRTNFWTAHYYAKLCWVDPFPPNPFNPGTICMPERYGTNAWIELGMTVTGKTVDVHTSR